MNILAKRGRDARFRAIAVVERGGWLERSASEFGHDPATGIADFVKCWRRNSTERTVLLKDPQPGCRRARRDGHLLRPVRATIRSTDLALIGGGAATSAAPIFPADLESADRKLGEGCRRLSCPRQVYFSVERSASRWELPVMTARAQPGCSVLWCWRTRGCWALDCSPTSYSSH